MLRKSIGVPLAVLTVFALTACGGDGGAEGSATTVRVTLANHVWTENIKSALPEFEQASGLKVELTQLGEDQLSDQYNVKLNAGSADLDVMMYRPLQEGRLFATNGYLADLTGFAKANADWDLDRLPDRPRRGHELRGPAGRGARSSPSRRSCTTARTCWPRPASPPHRPHWTSCGRPQPRSRPRIRTSPGSSPGPARRPRSPSSRASSTASGATSSTPAARPRSTVPRPSRPTPSTVGSSATTDRRTSART